MDRKQLCPQTSIYRLQEGSVLFNDALNTFYLRLYGVGHMVKDHSDSERGNTLPPHIQVTGRKEGTVLFNDALNIFYLRLYGVGHMVKDHSDIYRLQIQERERRTGWCVNFNVQWPT